eukprot:PhM_4_TR11203/c0_g1_i1/m.22031
MSLSSVPTVTLSDIIGENENAFLKFKSLFDAHQVLLVKTDKTASTDSTLSWLLKLKEIFGQNKEMVLKTWCGSEDTRSSSARNAVREMEAEEVLAGHDTTLASHWYASFIVQGDKAIHSDFLRSVPVAVPPFLDDVQHEGVRHTDPVWVFVGQNLQKVKKGKRSR